MSVGTRVLVVLGLVVFVLGGVMYVARLSAAQEALERPPAITSAVALQGMTETEQRFVTDAFKVIPSLQRDPAETLRLGYRSCAFRGLPESEIRQRVMELYTTPYVTPRGPDGVVLWYRAKYTICA